MRISPSVPLSHASSTPRPLAIEGLSRHCDLFCTVIDNFGDAGVCWRLACQLAREQGWQVRLFIDRPEALAAIRGLRDAHPAEPDERHAEPDERHAEPATSGGTTLPASSATLDVFGAGAVHVLPWPKASAPWSDSDIGDVVIEAFACTIPEGFLTAMAQRSTPPVWINLEYLSAEDWVPGCHLGRSPHPRLALTKTFFFPGMVEGTGGLLHEQELSRTRQLFLRDTQAQNSLWSRLEMAPPPSAVPGLIITLFAYENPAVESLLDQWADPALTPLDGAETITLIVPVGRISPQVAKYLGQSSLPAGTVVKKGRLSVHAVPFVCQDDYDRLLWLADLNFVRGEDSFVRAQWAEQPFVWQIYPQSEDAHLDKLDAALALYLAPLPAATRDAVRQFWHAWNMSISDPAPVPQWIAFWQHHAALRKHAAPWAAALQCPGSLSANLADFVESQLK